MVNKVSIILIYQLQRNPLHIYLVLLLKLVTIKQPQKFLKISKRDSMLHFLESQFSNNDFESKLRMHNRAHYLTKVIHNLKLSSIERRLIYKE